MYLSISDIAEHQHVTLDLWHGVARIWLDACDRGIRQGHAIGRTLLETGRQRNEHDEGGRSTPTRDLASPPLAPAAPRRAAAAPSKAAGSKRRTASPSKVRKA